MTAPDTPAAIAPTVTAIVLNFNGLGYVHEAVESLVLQDLAGIEVIVVDNGSSDGSDDDVERRFADRVRVLRAGSNLGFGAGNNVGFRAGGGRHFVLLNNDAVAAPGFVRALVDAAEADTRVGMVAAKVLDYADRSLIDTTGHLMYWDGLNRGRGRLEVDRGQFAAAAGALFPSGAAALYRRAMIEALGGFDERLFLYGDDADLGLRGRLAGWDCAYAPAAVAWHHYSRSAGKHSALKAFYVERNRALLLLKLFPWPLVLVSPLTTGWRMVMHTAGALTGRGAAARLAETTNPADLVAVTLRAWLAALRLVPSTLRARRRFRGQRRLGSLATWRLLWRFRLSAAEVALKD